MVTDTGLVENKLIEIPAGISMVDLQHIAEVINNQLTGLRFDQIRGELLAELHRQVIKHPLLFQTSLDLLRRTSQVQRGEKVFLGGTTQLFSQPEFKDPEKVKAILAMLEEDQLLYDILTPADTEEVHVTIGTENKFSGIQQCSMVTATYAIHGKTIGTIAVLGPTRMEYAKMISVMQFMTRQLTEVLKKFGL